MTTPVDDGELATYLNTLETKEPDDRVEQSGGLEELKTTPLFSGPVKQAARLVNSTPCSTVYFHQYALLGRELESISRPLRSSHGSAVFMNTDAPWSAFICGSQGSGKSYTLSCILENCLLPSPKIGVMPNPLAGVLFHYDNHSAGAPCEAAYLASHLPVTVLVSPSNIWRLREVYSKIPNAANNVKVQPLLLKEKHLNTSRMLRLMAFSDKDGTVPLYMEVIINILKDMAITSRGAPGLNYNTFLERINAEGFARDQKGPMALRLQLLESFMDTRTNKVLKKMVEATNVFEMLPGTLTIVDLSDPFVDPSSACVLFDICLTLFLENRNNVGKVVALDEAHKFMTQSAASAVFTESLLTVIREQRHKGARVIIATQEPTISPKLLDLCTMTFAHRFTSPEWLTTLKDHLAGVSSIGGNTKDDIQNIFEDIVGLDVGESLIFSPAATLDVVGGHITKLGMTHLKF